MARTLHMQLTPSRRSKRLVENGYYSVPLGSDPMNSSEDDDNMSTHSNSSLYSDRSIKYRESPAIATRRKRFRKVLEDSPQKRVNTIEQTVVERNSRFAKKSHSAKEKLVTSTSSTLQPTRMSEPPYSQSTTQLERHSGVVTNQDVPPLITSPNNMSAGDRIDIRTRRTEQVVTTSSYSTADESSNQREKGRSDKLVQRLTLQSIVLTLYQFLFLLIRNLIYSISKIVYLTALTIYSWEVKALAWRVGAVPLRILKFLFFLLLLLVTVHFVAKHGLGNDYVNNTREVFRQGLAGLQLRDSKASSTLPPTVTSEQGQDATIQNLEFEAALTKVEVAFAFKLSEMKESIRSLREDFDKTQQQLRNFDESKDRTDSKIASLQAHFEGQQKASDSLQWEVTSLQKTFQAASQDFATKKELNDRAVALSAQLSRLNDMILNMVEKYDGEVGNETRIQEIVTNQIMESFLGILSKTETSDGEAGRVQAMLLSWLNKHRYVTKEEVDSDLRSLQGLYATKLERVRQDARRHPSTITLEKIVERPLGEPQQQGASSDIEDKVKIWIQEALALYSADRIGLADHALESSGGFIASTRCSESYDKKTALVSFLGIPFYYNINTPRSMIQPGNLPGECWSFKGSEGYVVVGLSGSVRPTSFSLEHIPRELSLAGHIDSAPKDFIVLGLADVYDEKGIVLGSYRYDQDGPVVQQFAKKTDNHEFFTHIELRVRSNWGNPTYTCLYRFRVHGERAGSKNPLL